MVADISKKPWLRTLRDFYQAGEIAGWAELKNVPAYLDRFLARPAVQRGLLVPARG